MPVPEELRELRKLWAGFWSARVLLTANAFRVFDHLTAPKTARETARLLKTDERATGILLDALTGLGLLKKRTGSYRNSAAARRYLVTGSPFYQGDILTHADNLWDNWSGLGEVVATGKPYRASHNHAAFIKGMHNIALFKAPEVIAALGMKGVKKALDLGGGPGTYSMELARQGAEVTLFDLPDTIAVAKEVVTPSGPGTVGFVEGDILNDRLPGTYDLVFMSHLLHAFSEAECVKILSKSKKALAPGGRVAIHEFALSADRTAPPQSALFAVNMLVNTEGGRCYAPSEMKAWLAGAGLNRTKAVLLEDTVLVIGKA